MAKNPGTKFEEWVKQELLELYPNSKRTKASGSVNADGDVQAGPFEIECKDNPTQKSVSVTETTWKHTLSAARRNGKIPLVVNKNAIDTFVSLRWQDFINIITEAIDLEKYRESHPCETPVGCRPICNHCNGGY